MCVTKIEFGGSVGYYKRQCVKQLADTLIMASAHGKSIKTSQHPKRRKYNENIRRLQRKFRILERLTTPQQRQDWVDDLSTADVRRIGSCLSKIVQDPDRFLTPRSKAVLQSKRPFLHSAANHKHAIEKRRGALSKLIVKKQTGGFIAAGN